MLKLDEHFLAEFGPAIAKAVAPAPESAPPAQQPEKPSFPNVSAPSGPRLKQVSDAADAIEVPPKSDAPTAPSSPTAAAPARGDRYSELAGNVGFSTAPTAEPIGRYDHDEIEERMTPDERDDMQSSLDDARDEWVNNELDNYDPDEDIDHDEAGKAAGWSSDDIRDKAKELVEKCSNADEIRELANARIDNWHENTDRHGSPAFDELLHRFSDGSHYYSHPEYAELREHIKDAHASAQEDIDKTLDDERERRADDHREYLEGRYDSDSDRSSYLEDFHRNNASDSRFAGAPAEPGKWSQNANGSHVYPFDTSDGRRFSIDLTKAGDYAGVPVRSVLFSDDKGTFDVTGGGSAHEIFAHVVPAAVAIARKHDLPAVLFSAAGGSKLPGKTGTSRQRLYDRLVKTVAASMPDYSAIALPGDTKQYVVVKRALLPKVMDEINRRSPLTQVETLVKSFDLSTLPPVSRQKATVISPATDADVEAWHHPDAWSDDESPSHDPGALPPGPPSPDTVPQPSLPEPRPTPFDHARKNPLPGDMSPADIVRAIIRLRAEGNEEAAKYLEMHLPPVDPFAHLGAPVDMEQQGASGGDEASGAPVPGGLPQQVPQPDNPQSVGSLPPKIDKADGPHEFACVYLVVPTPIRDRVLQLGRMIPDEDVVDSGREKDPHLTLLTGL